MSWRRIAHLVRKEFIQLGRDPQRLRLVIVSPIIQLFIFGYAATTDIRHIATAVFDEDRTAASRNLAGAFRGSGYFEMLEPVGSPAEVDRLMDSGTAQAVIHIPIGFAREIERGGSAAVQLILDGSDAMTARAIGGYAGGVIREFSGDIAVERLDRMRGTLVGVPSITERTRVWYNPELTSVNYMVPAVLSMILLLMTMMLTSMSIVRELEVGTLEQIVVTPITPGELMVGKTIPFVLIGYIDMILIMLVAVLWFEVPVAGSAALLFGLTASFLLTTLGLGLFISTVSRTQQQAMMVTFFFMLPSIILSGFMFPIANMPEPIQWFTYAIPMRYYLEIVRGVFLKGNGLSVLWPQVAILLVYGTAIITLAAARFHKRLG